MNLKDVYITLTNCVTPLGMDVRTNIEAVANGTTGVSYTEQSALIGMPFYAGIINDETLDAAFITIGKPEQFTRLEKMMLLALHPVVKNSGVVLNERAVLVLSTTKGNITALKDKTTEGQAWLNELAKTIGVFFEFTTQPVIVSNACVSGILAISVAKRLLQAGMYDNAFIVAGDEVSEFVLSGFNSFQAMSSSPCKPYSANRTGVNLGEAAAAALVTVNSKDAKAKITGDGSVNDANHISGPSRTGEGLVRSVESALKESGISADKIDYISAHGTATPYNDEMEAIAFNRLGMQNVPLNSFKGCYGHTLGASGLLETVIGLESMHSGTLYASLGYDEPGTSQPINVMSKNIDKPVHYFLKTASGFGGCNTAVLFENVSDGNR